MFRVACLALLFVAAFGQPGQMHGPGMNMHRPGAAQFEGAGGPSAVFAGGFPATYGNMIPGTTFLQQGAALPQTNMFGANYGMIPGAEGFLANGQMPQTFGTAQAFPQQHFGQFTQFPAQNFGNLNFNPAQGFGAGSAPLNLGLNGLGVQGIQGLQGLGNQPQPQLANFQGLGFQGIQPQQLGVQGLGNFGTAQPLQTNPQIITTTLPPIVNNVPANPNTPNLVPTAPVLSVAQGQPGQPTPALGIQRPQVPGATPGPKP
jgi:hypothetical protein